MNPASRHAAVTPTQGASDAETRLRALYELSDRAARARSIDDVCEATLDAIAKTGLASRASVLLFDREGVMRFRAARGLSETYRRAVEGHSPWRPDTPDPAPILTPDVLQDAELVAYTPVFVAEGIRSLGFFPLVHDARVLGKFMLYHATPHAYTEDETRLAQIIAGHVSNAVARNAAERDLRIQAHVLERMVEGVSICDENGVIVYTNPAEDRIFGYERGELVGKHISSQNAYPSEENARRIAEAMEALRKNGQIEGPWHNVRKDGSTFTTHARITAMHIDGKLHYVCVQEDITEKDRAEAALRESEERFRALADAVPQIVFSARPDGGTDYYNRRWYEYTGLTPEETGSWGWQPVLHPDDLPRCVDVWTESVRTGKSYEIQYRFRRASDGQYRWHLGRARPMRDATGAIVRWFGTCTDIHDQKMAESALRESEERFRLLSESSPVGIFLAQPSGEAAYTNPACERICGFDGQAAGFGWTERVHPEDRDRVVEGWRRYAMDGQERYTNECRWVHKDGAVRHTNVRAVPVRRNGALIGHLGTVEDITEIREAASELHRARAQLAHNEKLSALGSLVGGVAHEVRTPLTYLSNNLSIIELNMDRALRELDPARASALRARLAPCMSDARESVERIDRLVEDLRKYTRLKAGEARAALPLHAVAREAVDLFRATRRGLVDVVGELAPTPAARVDRVQVQQILINLMENAYEANPADAVVRVSTRTEPDGWPALVVSDTGEGIPANVLASMWDPFYTTKPQGTGLGLSIVRRIVDEHGARIAVDSTVGKGTTFRIAFPPA